MRPDLYTHTIATLRFGETLAELSQQLHDAVQAARDTGKPAQVSITLKITPKAQGAQVFVTDEIKAKIPKLPREDTILFPANDGNLVRDDPRQTKLPGLRSIEQEQPAAFKTATN